MLAQRRAKDEDDNLLFAFPQGPAWLLERLHSCDYHVDEKNLCHSFAWISLTAILRQEMTTLIRRLTTLHKLSKDELPLEIHHAKQKVLKIMIEARSEAQRRIALHYKLPHPVKIRDFEARLTHQQSEHFNSVLREEIALRKEEAEIRKAHKIVDTLSLLESLHLYQHVHAFSELTLQSPLPFHASFKNPLHIPVELEAEGGLLEIQLFKGIYSKNEMLIYLRTLRNMIEANLDISLPFAFTLNNSNHMITIGFMNHHWIIIDSNQLNFTPHPTDEEAVDAIFASLAYPHADSILLTTKIYATKKNMPLLKNCVGAWFALPEFLLIHK